MISLAGRLGQQQSGIKYIRFGEPLFLICTRRGRKEVKYPAPLVVVVVIVVEELSRCDVSMCRCVDAIKVRKKVRKDSPTQNFKRTGSGCGPAGHGPVRLFASCPCWQLNHW